MKILVLGNGAREHAILWKLSKSEARHELFVCPGNVGMDDLAERLPVPEGGSLEGYARLASEHMVDLTVVGPESYLVEGIADLFQQRNLRIFGPTRKAALLEGSKVWAKEIMQAVGIPTASWRSFTDYDDARLRAQELSWECVIKADGLAAGKGAFVCHSAEDVDAALKELKHMGKQSSSVILVEELLEGPELSVFAISDGRTVLPFGAAQDHKPLLDGDDGPNTGGMGAYSPVDHMLVAQGFADRCFQPLVQRLRAQGVDYVGVLYAGAIVTNEGPKILEFNCRFGDPETEVLLSRLDSDLATLFLAATDGLLHTVQKPRWSSHEALCVVATSSNYPREGDFGSPITGIDVAEQIRGVRVFHAGTEGNPDGGRVVTNGGRILCLTATGENLSEARDRAYEGLSKISFKGMHYRRDIGSQALSGAWQARWQKPSWWEQQMRTVADGLDAVASTVRRLQLSDVSDVSTAQQLQDISQRLYALKLQAISPGETSPAAGLRLTWRLLTRYAEAANELLAEPISERPEVRTPAHGAAGDGGGAARSVGLDVITLQLDHAALRFEAHDNYDMLIWDCKLTGADAMGWLEKQRDTAGAFYVDTKLFTYEFDHQDTDIADAVSAQEPLSEVRAVRLENTSYTCIWSLATPDQEESAACFAILSPELLVEDVWWFMKATVDEVEAEAFFRFIEELQDFAGEARSHAGVN